MIGKIIGNLRIISEIGKGGMGVIYLAEHIHLHNRFAVKNLSPTLTQDPDFRERFYQEALNQALLDHPNIVQVTDFFEDDGQFFLVMQYVDGQDISKIINTKGKLSENEALSIFEGILKGLEFAHSKGIIHRDVKPSNILLDKQGRPRITDFGIAILVGDKRLTATGTTVGSPCYMSPEQIKYPNKVDHRSDIYCAGIVLYEMLVGGVPFDAETDFSIKEQQVNSPAPNPSLKNPKIPQELSKIILKAMAKEPDKRFQNCTEFLDSIKTYVKPSRENKLLWVVTTIGLASIGIAILFIISDKNGIQPNNKIKPELERQSVFILIQGASEKALIVCKNFKEIEPKKRNLEIAKEEGETAFVDKYNKQIQEMEQNIHNGISEYRDKIIKLRDFKKIIIDEEFDKYNNFLFEKKSFDQIYMTRFVQNQYQQYLNKAINIEITQEDCNQK